MADRLLQEDGTSVVLLEDGTSALLLEAAPLSAPFISSATVVYALELPTIPTTFIASATVVRAPVLSGGPGSYLTFDTTTTWLCPDDVTVVQIEARGGGAGGNSRVSNTCFAGGGGGAYARNPAVPVTPGTTYTVTVGAAVAAQTDGNASSFVGDSGTTVSAAGGSKPASATAAGLGGTTAASSGSVKFAGGNGGAGASNPGGGGGGGEGAGSTANGGNGASAIQFNSGPRPGGSGTDGGNGGNGGEQSNSPAAQPGQAPGGGGGGCGSAALGSLTGGGGARGEVRLTFVFQGIQVPFISSTSVVRAPALDGPGASLSFDASTTWLCPDGYTSVKIESWGGGGGGAASGANDGHGGGGGGAFASLYDVPVTPGNTYTVTVGASGAANSGGGDSTFVGDSSTTVTAKGGQGGSGTIAGAGGLASASTGLTKFTGGSGGTGDSAGATGGAGGGEAAGPEGNGASGTSSVAVDQFGKPGGSGSTSGGDGGTGGGYNDDGAKPTPGSAPGGGGGGSGGIVTVAVPTTGRGAAGRIRLTLTRRVLPDFIASTTAVYALTLAHAQVVVPFISSSSVVYALTLEHADEIPVEGIGPGNGGERWSLQLAAIGTSVVATTASSIAAGTGGTLALIDDTGLPTSGGFPLVIEDEVLLVRKLSAGNYGVVRRALSNTEASAHPSGVDATWDDTYAMAIATQVGMLAEAEVEGDLAYGWLIAFDASQSYLGADRFPMHVAELLGVFPPGAGASGSRLDGAQLSAVHTPPALSDDCPAAMTIPARLAEDIVAGDVALCRYSNPAAETLTLGPRATALQGWYGFGRRDDSNVDVTLSDPDGHVVDGTTHGEFFEESFITATLPGDDRTFTYGPPRFSNKGWPIAALAIRHGTRRVPLWTSPTWHNFDYVFTGFHADAVYVQVLVNRNGIIYGPIPSVDLPHPDDIDGPDATWDATSGYRTSTSWYVAIFDTIFIALGPGLNQPPSPVPPPPDFIPIIAGIPPGGGGGDYVPADPDVEGGSGGDISPPVVVGVHMHTDLGELPYSNPPL